MQSPPIAAVATAIGFTTVTGTLHLMGAVLVRSWHL